MTLKHTLLAMAAVGTLAASGGAFAAPCTMEYANNADTTDVTNDGGGSSSLCAGLLNGSTDPSAPSGEGDETNLVNSLFGGGYSLLGKSDQEGSGVAVSLANGTWSASGLSAGTEFVVTLKQATSWAAYYFGSAVGSTGTWSTAGWNIGNPAGGLSHLGIFTRGTQVPEPGTLALLGLGLLGAAAARRRKH